MEQCINNTAAVLLFEITAQISVYVFQGGNINKSNCISFINKTAINKLQIIAITLNKLQLYLLYLLTVVMNLEMFQVFSYYRNFSVENGREMPINVLLK